jgi:signal transduction histidine kinase
MNALFSRRSLLALSVTAVFLTNAFAEERGTAAEAKAMVFAAIQHMKKVGNERAFDDFYNDKATWIKKDLYVSVFDVDANWLAHGVNPKLVGKNLLNIKDKYGKEHVKEFVSVAKTKGEGWVDYAWAHPTTGKIEDKSTFVKLVDGSNLIVAVGIYR